MNLLFSKKSLSLAELSAIWLIIAIFSVVVLFISDINGPWLLGVIAVTHLLWVLSVVFMLNETKSKKLRKVNQIAALAPNVMLVLYLIITEVLDAFADIYPRFEVATEQVKLVYVPTLYGQIYNVIETALGVGFLISYLTSIVVWIINTYIVLHSHKLINIKNIFNLDKY